jgi:hypothetical protein
LFLKIFSSDFAFAPPKRHPESLLAVNGAVVSMEKEIQRIRAENRFRRPDFFQIVSFRHGPSNDSRSLSGRISGLDPVFLLPLEKTLQTKLAKTDNSHTSITQTNDDYYIFLVCIELTNKSFVEDCTSLFYRSYPNHKVNKNIYTKHPIMVHLAEKTPLNNSHSVQNTNILNF